MRARVAVREELVGFLGGAVKRRGLVGVGVFAERRSRPGAVNTATRSIHEVLGPSAAAGFEDAGEAHEIAVRVGPGVFEAVTHAGLGAEVDDVVGLKVGDEGGEVLRVGEVGPHKPEVGQRRELVEAGAFEGDVVVIGEVVHAEHFAALRLGEAAGDMVADEAGGAGHEDFHPASDSARSAGALGKRRAHGREPRSGCARRRKISPRTETRA